MCGDDQLALATHLHRPDAFVPALDDPAAPDGKLHRLAAIVRGVELGTALEPAGVVHAHGVAGLWPRARAFHDLDIAETAGGLDDLLAHGGRASSGWSRHHYTPRDGRRRASSP